MDFLRKLAISIHEFCLSWFLIKRERKTKSVIEGYYSICNIRHFATSVYLFFHLFIQFRKYMCDVLKQVESYIESYTTPWRALIVVQCFASDFTSRQVYAVCMCVTFFAFPLWMFIMNSSNSLDHFDNDKAFSLEIFYHRIPKTTKHLRHSLRISTIFVANWKCNRIFHNESKYHCNTSKNLFREKNETKLNERIVKMVRERERKTYQTIQVVCNSNIINGIRLNKAIKSLRFMHINTHTHEWV